MRAWALSSLAEFIAAIPAAAPASEDLIQQALDYIHQNQYRPDITLAEVADMVNLSPSHLAHLLKERAGVSYKQYLTGLRMEAAKRLLRTTNLTINSIGEAVGYQNATNFYRLFQRETGLTPAAYRRLA
jgi:two-component system, response regulator YesN